MYNVIVANNDSITITQDQFNLRQIASSGQCFRWYLLDYECHEYIIVAGKRMLHIKEEFSIPLMKSIFILDCSMEEFLEFWSDYFDLGTDYKQYIDAAIYHDGGDSEHLSGFLCSAVSCGQGIRILKQDPWECLITFIISQQNNIPRITGIVHRLCQFCGDLIGHYDGINYYSFPTAEQILDRYRLLKDPIGVGFRYKYIIDVCKRINGGYDLERLKSLKPEDAIRELKTFYGVGDKVANCVSLFGLGHKDAFPRDVWINRIINKYYGGDFDTSRFAGFSGVIQQYMFHYERMLPHDN